MHKLSAILLLPIIFLTMISTGCEKMPTKTTLNIEEINCQLTDEEWSILTKVADYEFDFYHSIFKKKYPILKVKLFGDSIEYQQYQKDNSKTRARNGFYSQLKKCAIVNKNAKFMKTIFHELNHFIFHYYVIEIPKWINEGLSEYFEYASVEGETVKIYHQPKKIERLKNWTSKRDKIDITDFITWSNAKWKEIDQPPDHYSYTLSWGLVTFFMDDELRREILKNIILDIKKGRSSTQAIDKYYPGGVEQIQYDFIIFVDLKL
jgi:Protein of unknown function (DUF1570)